MGCIVVMTIDNSKHVLLCANCNREKSDFVLNFLNAYTKIVFLNNAIKIYLRLKKKIISIKIVLNKVLHNLQKVLLFILIKITFKPLYVILYHSHLVKPMFLRILIRGLSRIPSRPIISGLFYGTNTALLKPTVTIWGIFFFNY